MNRRLLLKRGLRALVAVPMLGAGYGWLEAGWLRVQERTISVPRLPEPFAGLRIAHLSDFHHGPFLSRDQLDSIVATTNDLQPDLIAITGDFVSSLPKTVYIDSCLEGLSRLRAPLGVFAVPGNHDHWNDFGALMEAIESTKIVNLTNRGTWLTRGKARLRLGGVDDLWSGRPFLDAALGNLKEHETCLLLAHNPDFVERIQDRRVGLVLSGHTHGGQVVIPLVGSPYLPSRFGNRYQHGLVQTPWTQVFVSRGLGTTGLPLRFRCEPEINLLTLTPLA